MSQEKSMLLMLKGAMSELEPEEQQKVKKLVADIQTIVESAGDLQHIVVGIVSLEHAVAHEDE
jgi:hypothetical protein